jgi:GNAT superfamily N-acetyltransferase
VASVRRVDDHGYDVRVAKVNVRVAQPGDARVIAEVWAGAIPYMVRSVERAFSDLDCDAAMGRKRWVAELDDVVVGTATARRGPDRQVIVAVEVHRAYRGRGVGNALLRAILVAFPDAGALTAVCDHDPTSIAFGAKRGFVPEGVHWLWSVDPRTVAAPGPVPAGLTAVTLDTLSDLHMLLDAHNAAAQDDPSGVTRTYTLEEFQDNWWRSPDNAADLSWALIDGAATPPVIAAFTSMQVDRPRGRAWSSMTATRSEYRDRGLATWVKRRSLVALAAANITEAWTANDASNAAMLAINESLGYRPAARSLRLRCRLDHRT